MSQPADWGVPSVGPATPTEYAGRDNGSFNALLSGHIGATRPAYVLQGTNWLKDTGSSPLVIEEYFFDGTNDILIASHDVATGKSSFTNFVGSAVASSATIVIPIDGDYSSLTGTTTVSTMTVAANRQFVLKSASGLTLTAGAPIVTIDGNDLVLTAGQTVTLQSTAANVVQVVSVGSVDGGNGIILGTPIALTSGVSVAGPAIPSGTKEVVIPVVGGSTNGTSVPILQIGDSGGIEPTGYLGSATRLTGSTATNNFTTGFALTQSTAATAVFHGTITLTLENESTNTWVCTINLGRSDAANVSVYGGSKSLSGELTQFVLTTVGGTDAWDAGEFNTQTKG